MSQHFPLIAPPAPTANVCNVDDVGDTNDPLSGQSECDSDTKDRKVTPIFCSIKLIDFRAPNQPREIRIGSSLSPCDAPTWHPKGCQARVSHFEIGTL